MTSLKSYSKIIRKWIGRSLTRTSHEWGAQRVAWLTFRLLQDITGVEVPADVMRNLQPDPLDEQVVASALAQVLPAERAGWRPHPIWRNCHQREGSFVSSG